ncbi:MAG: urease accessory UreF family protein [Myxococcota bacterium]|nr:urease accessory UreF family protein [Myxococcota bacterium]
MKILSAFYLTSPSLPIGAFAYSQGLESAIERGHVTDRTSLTEWSTHYLRYGLARLDVPMLRRLYQAFERGDATEAEALNGEVLAMRETREFYDEEVNLGRSLRRVIRSQQSHLQLTDLQWAIDHPSLGFLAGFALLGHGLELDEEMVIASFLWSWLDNQVTVACKSIPLGQTDAQGVLLDGRATIKAILETPDTVDAQLSSLPGAALLSALHEEQYSRLFRS